MEDKLNPETIRTDAREFRAEAKAMDEFIEKMDSLLARMQSLFQNEAAASYAARFSELRPSLVEAKELSANIAFALDTAASIKENEGAV